MHSFTEWSAAVQVATEMLSEALSTSQMDSDPPAPTHSDLANDESIATVVLEVWLSTIAAT